MSDVTAAVSDEPVAALPGNEPVAEFGPAMRALHTRWQRAALALFTTKGNRTRALEIAGYKRSTGSGKGINVLVANV